MQAYIPFYFDWADHLSRLSDAEYGRLIKAILAFAMGVEDTNHRKLSPTASMAYKFITSTINRSEAKRLGREQKEERTMPPPVKRSKKTFKRVERTAEPDMEIESKSPTNSNITPSNQRCTDTNHSNNAEIKSEIPTYAQNRNESTQNTVQKNAPTREQARKYFEYRGFKSNPDEFFNFYESNGWKVGQNPMINWFSSAENWELRTIREGKSHKTDENPPRQGNFDVHEAFRLALERSYGGSDDDDDDE